MQEYTEARLQDAKNRIEKVRQALKIILGEEKPLTIQETEFAAHKKETANLPVGFLSYSHKDEAEKEKILSHLGVLRGAGLIALWNDDQIAAGSDWETDINKAIARSQVAILLITANFLTSEFILSNEVPAFLQRREHEGLRVFPVIAKACAWKQVSWLSKLNVRPKNGRPIWSDNGSHVDEDLAKIAEEIAEILKEL